MKKENKTIRLYDAGPLFNAAERYHNIRLEKQIIKIGSFHDLNIQITLPQRKALERFISREKGFDLAGIVEDCENGAANHDVILCNLDGTDADSGTAVEYGIARAQGIAYEKMIEVFKEKKISVPEIKIPQIITYRTDFRTAPEKEVGINAMLIGKGTIHIYLPCFALTEDEFETYYDNLATKIVKAIKK